MYYDIDFGRKRTELGILIGDREYWSHGYGTDAVMTMLRHIFTETPITLVYLHTLDWNARAQKSFAKCGFKFIKKVRRDGHTFHYMEVIKDEWLALVNKEAAQPPPSPASIPQQ
jgi:RimJ/RimL family protein N-acetyltransferase